MGRYNRKKDKRTRAKKPFTRVHCDLLEAAVTSKHISHDGGNYKYALIIVCDYTRMTYMQLDFTLKMEQYKHLICFFEFKYSQDHIGFLRFDVTQVVNLRDASNTIAGITQLC